jgi:predicted esterase YcpF (UPF0227 family)
MTGIRHVVYLHGFASSPESGKAQRFADVVRETGIGYVSDLNNRALKPR